MVGEATVGSGSPRRDSSAWEDEEDAAEGEMASARAEEAHKGGDSSSTVISPWWPPGVTTPLSIRKFREGTGGVGEGEQVSDGGGAS